MNSLLKTAGVPGRAQGRLTVTQLADGVLKYSILQRGKRTPGTGAQLLLYHWNMMYA